MLVTFDPLHDFIQSYKMESYFPPVFVQGNQTQVEYFAQSHTVNKEQSLNLNPDLLQNMWLSSEITLNMNKGDEASSSTMEISGRKW